MDGEPISDGAVASPTSPIPPAASRPVGVSSTGVFLISLVIQATGYAATYFFAQGIGNGSSPAGDLGRSWLGTWQLWLLISSSINGIGDLRIGTSYVFFVSRGRPIRALTGTYLVLRVVLVTIGGLLFWFLGPPLHYSNGLAEFEIVGTFMALPILWSVSTVYTQLWTSQGQAVRGQYPLLFESIVRTGALVLVANVYTSTGCGGCPTSFYIAVLVAYVLGASTSFLWSLPSVIRAAGKYESSESRRMFVYSLPLIGSMFLLYFSTNGVPLIVEALLGTAAFNVFLAANGFRILGLQLPTAIQAPLFPNLASLHAQRRYGAVRRRTWSTLRYTAMALVPLTLALVVYRVNILHIFYNLVYAQQASVPLAILAASILPAGLSQIIGTSLNATGHQRLELYVTSTQVAILVVASFLLMPAVTTAAIGALRLPFPFGAFGLNGYDAAATATLLSSLAALSLNGWFLRRLLAVHLQLRPVGTIILSAVAAFLVVSRLNSVLPVNRYYQLALGLFLGTAAYALVLIVVGELSKEDVRQIGSFLGLPWKVGNTFARLCWRDRPSEVNEAAPGDARGLEHHDDLVEPPPAPPGRPPPGST